MNNLNLRYRYLFCAKNIAICERKRKMHSTMKWVTYFCCKIFIELNAWHSHCHFMQTNCVAFDVPNMITKSIAIIIGIEYHHYYCANIIYYYFLSIVLSKKKMFNLMNLSIDCTNNVTLNTIKTEQLLSVIHRLTLIA